MQEEVRARHHSFPLSLMFVALALGATVVAAWGAKGPDYQGLRFRCNDLALKQVCLQHLRPECSLRLVPGKSIPAEAEEHLVVERDDKTVRVQTSDDLAGCVRLDRPEDALDYLRFFSSLWTVHFFDQSLLEIFPARKKKRSCIKACLPAKIWDRLGLTEAAASEIGEGFEVIRFAIRPDALSMAGVKVIRIVENISYDGQVRVVSIEDYEFSLEDIAGLGFPHYR